MSINASAVEQSRLKISATANAMLAGECSYIAGARKICGLMHSAGVDQFSEPFVAFLVIDDETDEVPVGKFREEWHPDAKLKHQDEWNKAESYAMSVGEPACRATIAWLKRHPTFGS